MKKMHLLMSLVLLALALAACQPADADPPVIIQITATPRVITATPEPTPMPTATREKIVLTPGPSDFLVFIKVLEKKCFGSAGCIVTIRPELSVDTESKDVDGCEVVYELFGAEDEWIDRVTVVGELFKYSESSISTESSDVSLTAKVLSVTCP